MKKYRISVVVPVHNAELYVCDALDGVVAQSRPPDQLIIVDDGSSDGSLKKIRTWASQYRGEIHVLQQNNHGVAAARNRGVRHAEAQLIAFLDADDLFLPGHLQLLEGAYANHPDLAVAFGDASYFDANGVMKASSLRGTRIEGLKWKEQENGLRLIEGSPYVSLVRGNYISLSASMISKDTLEGVGCFDETLQSAEDRDFFLRLSPVGPFAYYPTLVTKKRRHEGNLTHPCRIISTLQCQFLVLQKMLGRAKELNLSVEELEQTRAAMAEQVQSLLYLASCKGLGVYVNTCRYLMTNRTILPCYSPVNFLRALASQFRENVVTRHEENPGIG